MKLISLFILVISISVFQLNAQVVYSEDFETGQIPNDWKVVSNANDGGWKVGYASNLNSNYFVIPPENSTRVAATNDDKCNCDKSSDLLITNLLDLKLYKKLALQFDLYFTGGNGEGVKEYFNIVVSVDEGKNWSNIADLFITNGWERVSVDISSFAGKDKILFGFKYNDNGNWAFGAAIDNVVIKIPLERDLIVKKITSKKYSKTGSNKIISCEIYNNGVDTIKSLTLSWSGNSITHSQTFTGINLLPFTSTNFTLDDTYQILEGTNNIQVFVSNPNNMSDQDISNNKLETVIVGYTLFPGKGILFEEGTGTWCQWCPGSLVNMKNLKEEYGTQFVGVSVHDSDPMEIEDYDNSMNAFPNFLGYPFVIVNKKVSYNPEEIELAFLQMASTKQLFDISAVAKYKKDSRDLTIDASIVGSTILSGAKFFMVLKEDHVTGINSSYAQANIYSELGIPMGGFELLPNPVPAAQMEYNQVARYLFGTFNGIENSIISPLPANTSYTYEFTGYTIPAEFEISNLKLVVALLSNNNQVLNVIEVPLEEATSSYEVFNNNLATVSPNPFSEVTYVKLDLNDTKEVSMKVFNSLGQVVAAKDYGKLNGSQNLPFYANTLSNGMYYIHLNVGDELVTKQVILNRN